MANVNFILWTAAWQPRWSVPVPDTPGPTSLEQMTNWDPTQSRVLYSRRVESSGLKSQSQQINVMTGVDKNMYIVLHLCLISKAVCSFPAYSQSSIEQAGGWWQPAVSTLPHCSSQRGGAALTFPPPHQRRQSSPPHSTTAATAWVTTRARHSFYPPSSSDNVCICSRAQVWLMRSDRGGQPGLPGQLSATVTAVVYAVVSCDPPLVTRVTTLTCVLSVLQCLHAGHL